MSSERLNPSHERRNTHLKEDWKLKRENDNNSSGYGSDVSLIEAADIKEGNHADSVAVNQQGSIDRKQSEASNESTKNSPDSTILPCNEDTHTTNDLDSDGVYNIVPVSASETAEITSDEQCGLHHTCNDEYSIRYSEKRRDSNQEDNDDYTENDFKAFLTCTDNTKEADSGIDTNKEQADDSLDVSRATDSGTDVSGQARSDTDINRQVSSDTDVSRQAGNDTDINRHASSDTDVGRQAGSDTDINRHASSDTDVSRQAGSDTDINRHASSDTDVSRQARSDTDFSTQARSDMDVSRQAHSDRDVSRNDVCDMVANRDVEHIKDREEDTDSIADGDNYHVQHKEMEELEIQETNRPCLYSQKSTISTTSCQQNKVKVEKTHSDVVDSSKAERSERQRYKIEVS